MVQLWVSLGGHKQKLFVCSDTHERMGDVTINNDQREIKNGDSDSCSFTVVFSLEPS